MNATPGVVLTGPAGTATAIDFDLGDSDPARWQATIAVWWLDCPRQSPAWSHYVLSVIHLRDIPGVRAAQIRVPHATHEVLLYACDPAARPRADDPATWRALHPINLAEQVELPSDDDARELAGKAAQAVVDGVLWAEPPLSGQVEPWRTTLIKSSAHARGEARAMTASSDPRSSLRPGVRRAGRRGSHRRGSEAVAVARPGAGDPPSRPGRDRTRPTVEQRQARLDARWQIIQAANRWKLRVRYHPRLFGMRQLQRAVFLCRQHRLVKPAVLEAAGFRSGR